MLTLWTTFSQNKCPIHGPSKRLHFLARVKWFFWDELYLFKYYHDQIIRRCIPDSEFRNILSFCIDKTCSGHFNGKKTAAKILQYDFYWPPLFCDCSCLQPILWSLSTIRENFMMKWNVVKPDLSCQNLRYLGHWLHGSLPYVSSIPIYLYNSWLGL